MIQTNKKIKKKSETRKPKHVLFNESTYCTFKRLERCWPKWTLFPWRFNCTLGNACDCYSMNSGYFYVKPEPNQSNNIRVGSDERVTKHI